MKKAGPNAAWSGLSLKQRKTLETWLFEEGLGYEEALARAKAELGFQGSLASLKRFYQRRAGERPMEELTEARALAEEVGAAEVSTQQLRDAGMKLVAQSFLKLVARAPERVKDWGLMAKLLLEGEENDLRRLLLEDGNAFRRAKLEFAHTRFHYDTVEEAMSSLPELLALNDARKDPAVRQFEENKRMNDLRRSLFGDVIPQLLPENEQEEAHPEIIQRRYEEGRRKEHEQMRREYEERQVELAKLEKTEEMAAPAGTVLPHPDDTEPEADAGSDKPDDAEPDTAFVDEARPLKETPEQRQRRGEEMLKRAAQARQFRAGKGHTLF